MPEYGIDSSSSPSPPTTGFQSVWNYEFYRNPFVVHAGTGVGHRTDRPGHARTNAAQNRQSTRSGIDCRRISINVPRLIYPEVGAARRAPCPPFSLRTCTHR